MLETACFEQTMELMLQQTLLGPLLAGMKVSQAGLSKTLSLFLKVFIVQAIHSRVPVLCWFTVAGSSTCMQLYTE